MALFSTAASCRHAACEIEARNVSVVGNEFAGDPNRSVPAPQDVHGDAVTVEHRT